MSRLPALKGISSDLILIRFRSHMYAQIYPPNTEPGVAANF